MGLPRFARNDIYILTLTICLSLLAGDAMRLKAGFGEVVSKFDKHLGGCDCVINGAVGVV